MKTSRTILRNDILSVAIDLHGAELKSILRQESGNEYLWQADPTFWGRSAPILFPIVGMLRDNRYMLDGMSYSLPQHGFARDSTFERVSCTDRAASFVLQESETTRESYPYRFRLEASYAVADERIEVAYTVLNTDTKPMLFSLGSHPAFKIPFAGGTLEDYFIEFEHQEVAQARLPEDGLLSDQWVDPFERGRIIRLSRTLFDRGAFIFKDLKSPSISIKNTLNSQQIRVTTGSAPYLGIWSKPGGAPFVCLEPWFGVADSNTSDHDFCHKEGIITLAPDTEWSGGYTIQIDQ